MASAVPKVLLERCRARLSAAPLKVPAADSMFFSSLLSADGLDKPGTCTRNLPVVDAESYPQGLKPNQYMAPSGTA